MTSVVGLLLSYRDAERSRHCIQSLLADGAKHVVVWDNSADGGRTATKLRSICSSDERVDVQVSEANLGFAAGANRGLRYCLDTFPGTWVLLINDDACLLRGALAQLVSPLEVTPDAKVVFPNVEHAGRVLGPGYCHRLTGLLSWQPHRGSFAYASGCCQLIAVERITLPLFDEDFFMYGEDCELGWRLRLQPNAQLHIDKTLVVHDGSASTGLGSPFYESHMVAAHLILARKLARNPWDACLLYVVRTGMLLLRAGVRAARFHSLTPVKALWAGARIAFKRCTD
jgi:GT2 family glycosyltransferase